MPPTMVTPSPFSFGNSRSISLPGVMGQVSGSGGGSSGGPTPENRTESAGEVLGVTAQAAPAPAPSVTRSSDFVGVGDFGGGSEEKGLGKSPEIMAEKVSKK